MKQSLIIALILFALGLPAQAQNVPQNIPMTGQAVNGMDNYDQAVLNLLSKYDIPGASLTVMKGSRILLTRGYGWSDLEAQVAMQPDIPSLPAG